MRRGDNGPVLCGALSVARVDMSLSGRVRALRVALLAVWVGFLPAWLVALNVGVQPNVLWVTLSFVVWMGVWSVGHRVLRRERCPVCGGALFAGDLFESLRATACASCQWEFGNPPVPAPPEGDSRARDEGQSDTVDR